jgi:hypothetical protein
MKRNSTTIWIPSPNAITPLPWVNNAPDFTSFSEPTLSVLQASYEANKDNIVVIPEPLPQPVLPPEPDWEGLKHRAFGGDLYPIFERLRNAALDPEANTISTARGDITDAILTVKIEAALASGFQLLTQVGGYVFSPEEKALWQSAVDELHFSSLVYLP